MYFCKMSLAICLLSISILYSQRITINEVMFDLAGVDYHDEFVEIINLDSIAIDLSGFQVGDQDELDEIIVPSDRSDIIISPGEYFLILDGSYVENSSAYDSLISTGIKYALINDSSFGKSGFSNSIAETIILVNAIGDTLDKYQYSLNNDPGYSDEKILPAGPNIIDNWGNSIVLNGTPAKENSISEDNSILTIHDFDIEQDGQHIIVQMEIIGLLNDEGMFSVQIWIDKNFDGFYSDNDFSILDSVILMQPFLPVDLRCKKSYSGLGTLDVYARVFNETSEIKHVESIFWQSETPLPVTFNEIFFSPPEGEPEWLELYNHCSDPVKISSVLLIVNQDTLSIDDDNAVIRGNDFVVLSEFEELPARYTFDKEKTIHLQGWENLRINEESIILCNPYKSIIDTLSYTSQWWDGNIKGVSLEKKSVNLANRIGSWGICRKEPGATPGKPNSWISGKTVINYDHLQINSIYFSPMAYGNPNFLEIAVNEVGEGMIDLKIFDLRGRTVKSLALDSYIIGKQYYTWDGVNETGQQMPTGTYIIFAEFRGNDTSWIEKKPFALYWGK